MAVKTASKRKIKSFDVGTQDKVLDEVLSAGKSNFKYTEGQILPYDPAIIEDEPLIIEEPTSSAHRQGTCLFRTYGDGHGYRPPQRGGELDGGR